MVRYLSRISGTCPYDSSLVAVPTWTLSWSLVTPGGLTDKEQQSIGKYLDKILTPQYLSYHTQMQVEAAIGLASVINGTTRQEIVEKITEILKETRPDSNTVPEFPYCLTLKSDDPSLDEYRIEITNEEIEMN